jgi:hypothetical protein
MVKTRSDYRIENGLVREEEVTKMLIDYRNNDLTKEELIHIISKCTNFCNSIEKIVDKLSTTIETATKPNRDVIDKIGFVKDMIESLNKASLSTSNNEKVLEISLLTSQILYHYMKTLENINNSNNKTYMELLAKLGTIAIALTSMICINKK